ncbi:rod shape-determining protein MreC [Frankia sp. CNm7]|uniref:Cell shape-determining protein MreC n=1 Tax=Frankia nepalensis TaxID=1836974 RepID=A0A937RIN5_9ACTN|nr:rod shape-determining protein MreC [Frankia nepalensis]MBL7497207.1 rod shape-determining protein MreC [Frankia nepalensis]MBL7510358.1 rod shape-determining protein MreC [Frankia nepalensis]MBL7522686.1 rod shape-determining protein MreC [Frankia nepalensis]MBL7626696.1 rod shape-determining protein MreC [Frankia nepalensis]
MGREQRRSRLVVAILLVITFTLITIDYKTGRGAGGVRGFLHGAVGGVENGVTAVARPIGRTVSSLVHPNRYHDRADRLADENAALRRELASRVEVTRQAEELAALRLLADKGQYTIIPARVIAVGDVSGTDWTVTINAGKADGLATDKIVLNADGLVGTVVSLTDHTAVVRLFCDPRSKIGARLESTQLLGAVSGGSGPNTLTFTLYDASYRVRPGERLVTFGSLDYVAGVPIGEVTKVTDVDGLSRTAEVRPYVSVGKLDMVAVVVGKPPTDPGDRVLPPRQGGDTG